MKDWQELRAERQATMTDAERAIYDAAYREAGESLLRGLADVATGRVSRRDD